MKKTFFFMLLCLLTLACGKSGGSKDPSSSEAWSISAETGIEVSDVDTLSGNTNQSVENEPDVTVENDAITFETNIKMFKFTTSGRKKILAAAELIKEVIASAEFKKRVLNHRVNGRRTFVDNNGLSNAQIYQKILDASEKLTPGRDNEMDLELQLYSDYYSNTVGYTYPNTRRIWMNNKYFSQSSPALVTTNMVHEWLHKMGFGHDVRATPTRKYSVPYAIGYIVRDLALSL